MEDCFVDLYWLPVGAGTHFQRASLIAYGALLAAVTRRPRAGFVHAALKLRLDGRPYTLELMPIPARQETAPFLTGPVGWRPAGRLRLFRYQLLCREGAVLPDEGWVVGSPLRLTSDCATADRVLDCARRVPPFTWGRRAKGTGEMWTSDSAVSWLLSVAGIDAAAIAVPAGMQAPGWRAGLELALRPARPDGNDVRGQARQ
ncbi:MAG: hypothetical protein HYX53_15315 [Chloroflexi bacterium]|nr:hypothetical protein [Chloroflexota bacterium]